MLVTDGILLFDALLEFEFGKLTLRERRTYFRTYLVALGVIVLMAVADCYITFVVHAIDFAGMIAFVILLVLLGVQIVHIITCVLRRYCLTAYVMDKKTLWENGQKKHLLIAKSLSSDYSILLPVQRNVYRACEKGEILKIPIRESWMEENYLNGKKMRVSLINELKREIELNGYDKVSESSLEEFYQKSYFRLLIEGGCCCAFILVFCAVAAFATLEVIPAVVTAFLILLLIFILPRPWRYRVDLPNMDTAEGMVVYYKGEKVELDGRIEDGKFVWNQYTQRYRGITYSESQKQLGTMEASRLSTYLEVFLRKRKLFKHNGGSLTD